MVVGRHGRLTAAAQSRATKAPRNEQDPVPAQLPDTMEGRVKGHLYKSVIAMLVSDAHIGQPMEPTMLAKVNK